MSEERVSPYERISYSRACVHPIRAQPKSATSCARGGARPQVSRSAHRGARALKTSAFHTQERTRTQQARTSQVHATQKHTQEWVPRSTLLIDAKHASRSAHLPYECIICLGARTPRAVHPWQLTLMYAWALKGPCPRCMRSQGCANISSGTTCMVWCACSLRCVLVPKRVRLVHSESPFHMRNWL